MGDVRELATHRATWTGAATALAYFGILVVLTGLLFGVPYLIFLGM